MKGQLKIWQGMFTRWRTHKAELQGDTLNLYEQRSSSPAISLDVSTANIFPVVDDPTRFMLRCGDTVLNLRASTATERVMWVRSLLRGREEALEKSVKSAELYNGAYSTNISAVRQLLDEVNRYRYDLTNLVKNLVPILTKNGIEISTQIVTTTDELNRCLMELTKIFDNSAPSQTTIVSPSKTLLPISRFEEQTISNKKAEPPNTHLFIDDDFQSMREVNGVNDSMSHYHSFIDEGYDGLSDFNGQSDWKYARMDSFHQNKNNVATRANPLLKKVQKGSTQKLLSQNRVYQQLPNIVGTAAVRYSLPQVESKEQLNLLGIIRGVIGEDIFSLNLPIVTNEPLSTLQKLAEQFIYQELLVRANIEEDSSKRLLYVLAFAISGYATQVNRTKLPLKPLIGETYELVDERFRYVSEQVNRHTSAFHCQSSSYVVEGSLEYDTRFTGKAIESKPKGNVYVYLKRPKLLVSFVKCTSRLTNLVFGEVECNISGEMTLNDERNDISFAKLKGKSSLFVEHGRNEVEGWLKHAGAIRYTIEGRYDEFLDAFETRTKLKTRIWQQLHRQHPQFYYFTDFSIQLNYLNNELFKLLPTTDTRLRPDLRALENGLVELAEQERERLYLKEKELEHLNPPLWFTRVQHPLTGETYYRTNDKYWQSREYGSWERCKDIF